MSWIIKAERVLKEYVSGRTRVKVLWDVDLEVERGRWLLVHGPSGSGKSTLLNLLGTLTKPTSGRVLIEGKDVSHLPEHFLVELRRRKIGFVFQQFNLLHGYSATENIELALMPLGIGREERRERAMEILGKLNLEHRAHFKANELSGGEQQRVSIARALINNPDILLADEPSSNVDMKNAQAILEIFGRLRANGKTLVVASNDPFLIESNLPDEKVALDCLLAGQP